MRTFVKGRGGGPSSVNMYEQGGGGLQKREIAAKGNIRAADCFENNTLRLNRKRTTKTRGKPQAPSSSYLAFLIVSRSSYIIIQPSFISFTPILV